jgi:hypothetical protein
MLWLCQGVLKKRHGLSLLLRLPNLNDHSIVCQKQLTHSMLSRSIMPKALLRAGTSLGKHLGQYAAAAAAATQGSARKSFRRGSSRKINV